MIASCMGYTPIRRVLAGKSILLTGATGFIGKVLLEKILRTIPEIGTIFILVLDAEQTAARAEYDIFSSGIFDLIKDSGGFQNLVASKIRFVTGDTAKPRLSLGPKDYMTLVNRLDLVIDSPLSTADPDQTILTNTLPAKHVSEFVGETMRARLVYLSTCYVNEGHPQRLEEKLYPQPPARRRLPLAEDGQVDLTKALTLLASENGSLARDFGWNNVYTFSKWLGENFIAQNANKIYASIVRPSIVESCLEAPHAGWIEGWKVADPLLYAGVIDQLPYLPADPQCILDFVPVDLVCNSVLAILPELMSRKQNELKIYHACNGDPTNQVQLGELKSVILKRYRRNGEGRSTVMLTRGAWAIARVSLKALSLVAPLMFRGAGFKRKITEALQLSEAYAPYTFLRATFANDRLVDQHAHLAFEDRERYPVTFGSTKALDYITDVHIPGLFKNVLQRPLPAQPAPVRLTANAKRNRIG